MKSNSRKPQQSPRDGRREESRDTGNKLVGERLFLCRFEAIKKWLFDTPHIEIINFIPKGGNVRMRMIMLPCYRLLRVVFFDLCIQKLQDNS